MDWLLERMPDFGYIVSCSLFWSIEKCASVLP